MIFLEWFFYFMIYFTNSVTFPTVFIFFVIEIDFFSHKIDFFVEKKIILTVVGIDDK